MTIADRRVLVVGASSGIGRSFAVQAARAGARVALAARRVDRVQEAVDEAGSGIAIACDVQDDAACEEAVGIAAETFGSLDLLFHAAGSAPLRLMRDTDPETWQRAFDTNVVGLQRILRHAVPHMSPRGVVAVLSSETVSRPRSALGAYGATKAALDESLRAWQLEHPELRFSRLTVGATQPTEFGAGFDMAILAPAMRDWFRQGLMQEQHMDTVEVAGFFVSMLGAALANPSLNVEQITLRSPTAAIGPPEGPSGE
jgi:NADP-dependent 3-hydroxy acid dehydrogenase YdfG